MNHLAIDTATDILSVALRRDRDTASDVLVASRDVGLRHSRRLMTLVHALMDEAELQPIDLDLVSCTRGPGSFTGLRIGMATAKGLAWAVAAARAIDRPPLVSVPTLDAMAAAVASTTALVVPVIDGKKGRFYGAAFLAARRLTDDLDLEASALLEAGRQAVRGIAGGTDRSLARPPEEVIVTGPHAHRFAEACRGDARALIVDPSARSGWAPALLRLAEARLAAGGYDPVDAGPEYVRGSDAEISRASLADR
ncbi:MAG: tRNA (adenosine(37)-N6)-threonylcarbamoyltransferase complex dimerization subunit type 1 TsaB [Spirochaetota bacterium]